MANKKEQNKRKANPLSDKEIQTIEIRSSRCYVEKESFQKKEDFKENKTKAVSSSVALRDYLDKKRVSK